MESSSSGRFHDYSGSESPKRAPIETGVGTGSGSEPGTDRCAKSIESARLEEIEKSEYFSKHANVPPVDTKVQIRKKLVKGRIAVETVKGKESIGFLPTKFNYLAGCLETGWSYEGKIIASSNKPIPRVVVELSAS